MTLNVTAYTDVDYVPRVQSSTDCEPFIAFVVLAIIPLAPKGQDEHP